MPINRQRFKEQIKQVAQPAVLVNGQLPRMKQKGDTTAELVFLLCLTVCFPPALEIFQALCLSFPVNAGTNTVTPRCLSYAVSILLWVLQPQNIEGLMYQLKYFSVDIYNPLHDSRIYPKHDVTNVTRIATKLDNIDQQQNIFWLSCERNFKSKANQY